MTGNARFLAFTSLVVLFASGITIGVQPDDIPDETNVQLWECMGGHRQEWQISASGYPNNHISLKYDGKVLDILAYSNDSGANVQVTSSPAQLSLFY